MVPPLDEQGIVGALVRVYVTHFLSTSPSQYATFCLIFLKGLSDHKTKIPSPITVLPTPLTLLPITLFPFFPSFFPNFFFFVFLCNYGHHPPPSPTSPCMHRHHFRPRNNLRLHLNHSIVIGTRHDTSRVFSGRQRNVVWAIYATWVSPNRTCFIVMD